MQTRCKRKAYNFLLYSHISSEMISFLRKRKRNRETIVEWIFDFSVKLRKKVIYSSSLFESDTTKGDGGWCIVPPLSALHKYNHAQTGICMTARTLQSPLLRHGTNARSANHRRIHDDDDDVEDDSLQLSIL